MPLETHSEADITTGNRTSPTADLYHEIWESLWPRNPTGWMFMGRAVHSVGAKLFPSWKKYTPYGLLPDVCIGTALDNVLVCEDEQERYANWLINRRGDDPTYIFRTNSPFDYLDHGLELETVNAQEWELACDLSQEEWSIGLGNQRMFREVQLRIVQEAEAGNLIIGSRPIVGGEPKPHSRDWWFTDHYENRFRSLTIDPNNPFSHDTPDRSVAHHLFIDAEGLAALVGQLERADDRAPAVDGFGDPSPYLRLMIDVQNQLGIGSGPEPKKASVLYEIQSRWAAYGLPASDKLMGAMATLLRSPESQAGRGRKPIELEHGSKG